MTGQPQVPGPNWYDVLDVDSSASTEEVREAWRAAIAELTPADRRFRLYNQAAEVLLDPGQRAAHDAALAAHDTEADAVAETEPATEAEPTATVPGPPVAAAAGSAYATSGGLVPGWLLASLGLLVWVSLGALVYLLLQPSTASAEDAAAEARGAAERAVIPVLSYDYETLEEDQRAAHQVMTADYREQYDELFAVLEENAPSTQAEVDVTVVSAALTRVDPEGDRVEVLLFIDRPTTNRVTTPAVVYRDQATLTMQRVDGEWLVDDVRTSPAED